MRISYLRNKTREIPNLSDDHCAHPVTDTGNGKDWDWISSSMIRLMVLQSRQSQSLIPE